MSESTSAMESRVAVLVDADNVETGHIAFVLNWSGKHGTIVLKRAFGRLSSINGHAPRLTKHGFTAEVAFPAGNGKNAADLMLAQYALRLAERRSVEMIALASSDGDFAPIASGLVEAGVRTIGFGRKDTPQALRDAVDLFVVLPARAAQAPAPRTPASTPDRRGKLAEIIENATEEGRAKLSTLGARLRAEFGPGYLKQHGAKTLTDLIARHGCYGVEGEGTVKWVVRRPVNGVNLPAPPAPPTPPALSG
jgi:hypothetical protein